jgi:hypothetical protein
MTFNDDGYEWHETTTHEDASVGRRVFIKGRSLNRVSELVHGINDLVASLESREQSPGAQKLARELRALL